MRIDWNKLRWYSDELTFLNETKYYFEFDAKLRLGCGIHDHLGYTECPFDRRP